MHLLQPEKCSGVQVLEWVTMDQFLQALPPEECMAIRMRAPQTPTDLVGTLECALATLGLSKQEAVKMKLGVQEHLLSPPGPSLGPKGIHLTPLPLQSPSTSPC